MKARIKRIQVSPETFLHIMKSNTAWRVSHGVPDNAKMRGCTIDPYTMTINIFVEHESFDAVDLQEVAPLLKTEFRRIQ